MLLRTSVPVHVVDEYLREGLSCLVFRVEKGEGHLVLAILKYPPKLHPVVRGVLKRFDGFYVTLKRYRRETRYVAILTLPHLFWELIELMHVFVRKGELRYLINYVTIFKESLTKLLDSKARIHPVFEVVLKHSVFTHLI